MAPKISTFSDGLAVRAARLETGLTQEGLSRLAGVSRARLAHIEAGLHPQTVVTLNRLCRASRSDWHQGRAGAKK